MFVADIINFQEMVIKEPLPLATMQRAVIGFVRGREDVALFGAQAVNVYVNEPRATQDVDLMSTRAADFAEELRAHLSHIFHVAVRVREIKAGLGYRIFQLQKGGNRHLVAVRMVESLPATQVLEGVQVLLPAELIASKVTAYFQRRGRPKSGTDWRDVALLLLAFPALKVDPGPVTDCLHAIGAGEAVLTVWRELVAQDLAPETEDDDF